MSVAESKQIERGFQSGIRALSLFAIRFAFSAGGQSSFYHSPYSFLQAKRAKIGKDNQLLHLRHKAHSRQEFG
jgi:hypothetical protein